MNYEESQAGSDVVGGTAPPENSLDQILDERGKQYGVFAMQAVYAQSLKATMRGHPNYPSLSAYKQEALDMIVHKIARILNGNSSNVDSWVDIAGYATLVAETLEGRPR